MRRYNKSRRKGGLEEYDRYLNSIRRKHKKKVNAQDGIEPYQIEVKNDNVMKAYKILEKILKKDRVLENYIEKQRYRKPSEIKAERKKRRKKKLLKEKRQRELLESFSDK